MQLLQSLTENLNPSAYRPSSHERDVLILLAKSDTPQMAYGQSSTGQPLTHARDKLIRLGFIVYNDGGLTLSDSGEELSQAQAITPDTELENETNG